MCLVSAKLEIEYATLSVKIACIIIRIYTSVQIDSIFMPPLVQYFVWKHRLMNTASIKQS